MFDLVCIIVTEGWLQKAQPCALWKAQYCRNNHFRNVHLWKTFISVHVCVFKLLMLICYIRKNKVTIWSNYARNIKIPFLLTCTVAEPKLSPNSNFNFGVLWEIIGLFVILFVLLCFAIKAQVLYNIHLYKMVSKKILP